MTNELIQIFLDKFNYLNTEGQRNGWKIFRNRELIKALEETARNLRKELTSLIANTELTDADKAKKFHDIIRSHFYEAEVNRAKFGTPADNAKPFDVQTNNGITYQAIWKKPYPPANFETALTKALDAVNKQVAAEKNPSAELKTIQGHCTMLADEIKKYKPKEKYAIRISM